MIRHYSRARVNENDIYHEFFYDSKRKSHRRASTVSYEGMTFYSYSTTIAQLMDAPGGQRVLFLMIGSMDSSFTPRHRNNLKEAAPPTVEILRFPFHRGTGGEFDVSRIRDGYMEDIRSWNEKLLRQAKNREWFDDVSAGFRGFVRLFGSLPELEVKEIGETISLLDRLDAVSSEISAKRGTSLAARRENEPENAERRRKRRLALDRKVDELGLKDRSVTDLARLLYEERTCLPEDVRSSFSQWFESRDGRFYGKSFLAFLEEWQELSSYERKRRNDRWNKLSFVWRHGDFVRTSQRLTVPVEAVREAFRVFDALPADGKQAFEGHKVGDWSVVECNERRIRIGCHDIPMENIEDLRKEVFR